MVAHIKVSGWAISSIGEVTPFRGYNRCDDNADTGSR